MKKMKDAVIFPRKLLDEILLTSPGERDEVLWHTLKYGLDLEEADNRYTKFEEAIVRANTDYSSKSSKPKLTDEEYERIISHLNERTGKRFRSTASDNRKWMNRPINAGYTVDDMIKVIDIMCDKWLPDSRMHQYLRPETLFGSKFAGYLNAAVHDQKKDDNTSFSTDEFFTAALERAYGGKI
ncbi:MAG: conserved phage C-terminal domain-containing protein [Eubacteriales bacterium]